MSSFKEIRRKSWLKIILFYAIISLHSPSSFCGVSAIPNGPRLVGIIPPPQVLLPPHREEGQSLDDIIYGTSFSGGSLFPSALTSFSPSITTTVRPSQQSHHANFQSLRNRVGLGTGSNPNLVQTFIPPSPPPLPSTTTTTTTPRTTPTSRPFSAPSNSIFAGSSSRPSSPFTSGEEIKVPQTLKLRQPHRKQYSKADLIAAANSLKPMGFDFNKLSVLTPSHSRSSNFKNSSEDKSSHLYQNARFPLPLFDTPVFNELRPLMEMIMKQRQLQQQQKQQQQQQQQAKLSARNSDSANDNNKKVLVIIPKQSSSGNNGNSVRTVTNRGGSRSTPPSGNRQAKQLPSFPTTSRSPPSTSTQDRSPSSSKFIVVPKTSKLTTTRKPKSFHASTTKRTSSKLSEISKKSEKNPDLQVAATSNKLTQQKTSGKPQSSSGDTDKRSYSIKGADKYSFSYEVKNDAFGDVKSHSESRDGDLVTGEYSMLESDGYTRIVKYSVDADQGFKASVKRIPPVK